MELDHPLACLLPGNLYDVQDIQTVWLFTLGITVVGVIILLAVFSPFKPRK